MPQRRQRELLGRHRFREQKALNQIEPHVAHGDKIRTRLDAFRDRACAIAVGEIEDLAAHRLFQAIVGAAGDEFSIDLEFDKRKAVNSEE